MLNLIINNSYINNNKLYIFNKKNLFFFKFIKFKNINKKNKYSMYYFNKIKILNFFIDNLIKFHFKKYNYFKFSIIKYTKYINYKYVYEINNFLLNYKNNWFLNDSNIYIQKYNYNYKINNFFKIKKNKFKLNLTNNISYKINDCQSILNSRNIINDEIPDVVLKFKNIKLLLLNIYINLFRNDKKLNYNVVANRVLSLSNFILRRQKRRAIKLKNRKKIKYTIFKKKTKLLLKNKKKIKFKLFKRPLKYYIKFKYKKKIKSKIYFYKKITITRYIINKPNILLLKKKQKLHILKIIFNAYNKKTYQWRITT